MKRLLAATVATTVGLALGVGLSPTTASAHSGTPSYTPPPIAWGACTNATLKARGAECGFVIVPLDYDRPGGTTIKIAVSRIKAKSPAADYQGVMLVNPGGPGGSGLIYSVLQSAIPNGVGNDYDWIGFDPRGVGSSVPSLTCDGNVAGYNRPYYVPVTKQLEKTWLDRSKAYAQACAKAGGPLLDHLKTTDNVADMESIRKALGQKQINFYGFSYGTYLGQVYATQHPAQVRRMVFDGVVDPRGVWYDANLSQDIQFDKNMDIYFTWVAKYDAVYHLGNTGKAVKAKYYATLQKLRTAPAEGKIGPDEWNDIFVSAGYYVYGWEDVATAFSAYVNNGDASGLLDLYSAPGPGADNGYAIYLGTQCTDTKWPKNWDKWKRDNWRIYQKYPFITWNNAWFNAPCLYWKGDVGRAVDVNGKKAPPILLISETKDAATPYAGSLEIRQRFPRSVLIEGVGGTTHAGSLSGIACTDDTIANYLDTGALPNRVRGNRSDKQCAPVPQPDPTAAAAKSLSSSGSGSIKATLRNAAPAIR
ncbi:alpha/beta hydrolase [Actinoplanes bogorensis]|uniref:Alpha/beta hydrolase n=1 Tax=Paractinoplanes bogorensis TaxID=1610840 RepID=A0ABS5YT42_9ACTN|nr:alpha/beta fold hydrolase [Actinoplanes bogorensis]MBU2666624.1 alpha/beta hydrolase [Actinoplanes bogorensis]